jgi:hypothetical protein
LKNQVRAKLDPIASAKSIAFAWARMCISTNGETLILRKEVPDLELTAPIKIGDNVYIGMRTIKLPGITIGNRCINGAGSVGSKSIPDNSVAAGVSAKVIKSTDEYLNGAEARSHHLGHLAAKDKAEALKAHFAVSGNQ